MDYRCPICGIDAGLRKFAHSVVARMEVDCPGCMNRLQLNVHPIETAVSVFGFTTFVALGALAYWLQSQSLLMLALVAGLSGASATPLLGRTYLRDWPRFAPSQRKVEKTDSKSRRF